MKPWEETWTLNVRELTADVSFPDGHAAEVGADRPYDARDPSEQDIARAHLIAAAPEIARIALALAFVEHDETRIMHPEERAVYASRFDAALRKAGVR